MMFVNYNVEISIKIALDLSLIILKSIQISTKLKGNGTVKWNRTIT